MPDGQVRVWLDGANATGAVAVTGGETAIAPPSVVVSFTQVTKPFAWALPDVGLCSVNV